MKRIVYILLPDIRSAYNVGSVFRTADCFGMQKIYLTGTTPQPIDRFNRPQKEIAKTALGAEKIIPWEYSEHTIDVLKKAKKEHMYIVGIEQSSVSISVSSFLKKIKKENIQKMICVFGNEVDGIPQDILNMCDSVVEIDMKGKKESLNVSVCAGVVLYELSK